MLLLTSIAGSSTSRIDVSTSFDPHVIALLSVWTNTITERVFYHDLLITKLYHIDYKKYTDNIHDSKDMLRGF